MRAAARSSRLCARPSSGSRATGVRTLSPRSRPRRRPGGSSRTSTASRSTQTGSRRAPARAPGPPTAPARRSRARRRSCPRRRAPSTRRRCVTLLADAAAALEPGRERPLTARRLAEDALHRLELAADRAESERALPGDVHERQEAVARRQAAVAEALARIRENLSLAASRSAPACVVDIEAGEAAAAQLHQQTARAAVAAAELIGEGDLRAAAEQLATGLELLDQAEPLVERVEAQLAELAHTALVAREAVREAEAATDEAWVALESSPPGESDGGLEVVHEARRLAERARAALGEPKPDWFEVRELSERACRLVGALEPTRAEAVAVSPAQLERCPRGRDGGPRRGVGAGALGLRRRPARRPRRRGRVPGGARARGRGGRRPVGRGARTRPGRVQERGADRTRRCGRGRGRPAGAQTHGRRSPCPPRSAPRSATEPERKTVAPRRRRRILVRCGRPSS